MKPRLRYYQVHFVFKFCSVPVQNYSKPLEYLCGVKNCHGLFANIHLQYPSRLNIELKKTLLTKWRGPIFVSSNTNYNIAPEAVLHCFNITIICSILLKVFSALVCGWWRISRIHHHACLSLPHSDWGSPMPDHKNLNPPSGKREHRLSHDVVLLTGSHRKDTGMAWAGGWSVTWSAHKDKCNAKRSVSTKRLVRIGEG